MSQDIESTFEDYFPVGCPPAQATGADGTVYRLVTQQVPTADDFRTHVELGRAKIPPPCNYCSISVFKRADDAAGVYLRAARKHGREGTKIGRFVAKLSLKAVHGRMQCDSSHCDWWPFTHVNRLQCFVEIVKDAGNDLES